MCAYRSWLVIATAVLAAAGGCTSRPGPDEWPTRPVRLIVPFGAGNSNDVVARLYAPLLSARWRRAVVVDNRPGGDGAAGVQAFVTASDGHTLLLAPTGMVTVNPLLHDRLPYDPQHDLVPISAAVRTSIGIAAANGVSVNSLPELTAFVRRHPSQYLWTATPGLPELVFKAFLETEKLQMTHVAYRDLSSAVHDFTAGRVHVIVAAIASMKTPLEQRAARLLAVTNSTRTQTAPDVPTAREAGYPMLTVDGLFGFFGWRDMPSDLRHRIAEDVRHAAEDRELGSRLSNIGLTPAAGSAGEFVSAMAAQRKQVGELASILGLRQPDQEGGR